MGVDHYLLFIFKQNPRYVMELVRRFFVRLDEGNKNTLNWTRSELENLTEDGILKRKIELVHGGYLWLKQPLQTVRGESIEGGDFRIYQVDKYSVLELHPNPRSRWWDVYNHELLKFLTAFMNEGALLIAGYQDDVDLAYLGLEYDNYYLLLDWLVERLKHGGLRVLPSAFSLVKKELVKLDDGLYALEKGNPEEWDSYVLVKTMKDYKILMRIWVDDLSDNELYREHFENPTELSGLLTSTTLVQVAERVEDEELLKKAERILKAQIGST